MVFFCRNDGDGSGDGAGGKRIRWFITSWPPHGGTKWQKFAKNWLKNSWNWLVLIVSAKAWQILNMKCTQWPETEIIWICWNLLWKNRKKNIKWTCFRRVFDIWNLCAPVSSTKVKDGRNQYLGLWPTCQRKLQSWRKSDCHRNCYHSLKKFKNKYETLFIVTVQVTKFRQYHSLKLQVPAPLLCQF